MRWLPVLVLVILVGCVLSIAFMNDNSQVPGSETRPQGSPNQPSDSPILAPAPQTNP